MKPRKITQIGTLKLVRRPLPPASKVIVDRKTKKRRKRLSAAHMDMLAQSGEWMDCI